MKSSKPGKRTLGARTTEGVEILNVSPRGIWIYVAEEEHFLSVSEHPWFLRARIDEICNVQLTHGVHLRWPDLDVDLHLDSLRHPERFPLQSRVHGRG
jgi:hypothetical protein